MEKSHTGNYPLPVTGGSIPASWDTNWWQQGLNPVGGGGTAALQAGTDAYAQTIATLAPFHYEKDENSTKKTILTSALSRILHRPNAYQTLSDFMLNVVKELYLSGNSYVVGLRNDRNEFSSIHHVPSRGTMPYVDEETGSVFYSMGNNPLMGDIDLLIPARDVMHLRLHCPRHPLVGISPIENAAMAIAANAAISSHQANFFNNMSRPSGVLSTELKLNPDQMNQLRIAWESQAKNMASGGIPILSSGIKWEPMSLSAIDAQIVEAFNMTVNDIARALRIPLPLVQLHNEASTYNNVEQMYAQWLSGGLGFLVEHIEQNFSYFFGLPRTQGTEFDTDSLLRTDFKGKVEGYTKGIQGGLFTPDEARKKFGGLKPVDHGGTVYVQQQMVPLGSNLNDQGAEMEPVAEPAPELDEDSKSLLLEAGILNSDHVKSFI